MPGTGTLRDMFTGALTQDYRYKPGPWREGKGRRHSDVYLLGDEEQKFSDDQMELVNREFPVMRGLNIQVKNSFDRFSQRDINNAKEQLEKSGEGVTDEGIQKILNENKWPGGLETYGPNETGPPDSEKYMGNPFRGWNTVELFYPMRNKTQEQLTNAIMGDGLHRLPSHNKEYEALRQEFSNSRTDKQKAEDLYGYEESGDTRTQYDWDDTHRLDAYIRGLLFPDSRNDWGGKYIEGSPVMDQEDSSEASAYTRKQREIGGRIMDLLRRGT